MSDSWPLGNAPTGRRLEAWDTRRRSTVYGLTPADDYRLKIARRHFTEATVDEYERDGKYWIEKATGERYRLAHGDPSLSEHPPETGVTVFLVVDGCLVYLRPSDATSASRTLDMGTVGEVRA